MENLRKACVLDWK